MKKKVMLQGKLLRVSILLIVLFTLTIFFVTDNRINNLEETNISAKMDCISNLGMEIINNTYAGDWNVNDGKLYKGTTLINNNFAVVDLIKEKTGSYSTIFLGDERVSTSIMETDGKRAVGTKVSKAVSECVLKKGTEYTGSASVLGEKYEVKYVPIKDNSDKVIGIWFVGIPKSYVDSEFFKMRASIIIISLLCGIPCCILLMLFSKKYLKDINTLKVSFLESNSNSNKTQHKVLMMSLFLICSFLVIFAAIQFITIGTVVNNLEENNIKDRVACSSELGYALLDTTYKGDWSISNNTLYKGEKAFNNDTEFVDKIKSYNVSGSSIFMGDIRVSTTSLNSDGSRSIGAKASNEVIETVLKNGNTFMGETIKVNIKILGRYTPIKDATGKIIGIWSVGIDKQYIDDQIADLRLALTIISVLASILAFIVFIFLSMKMISDIRNFDVSLQTKVN